MGEKFREGGKKLPRLRLTKRKRDSVTSVTAFFAYHLEVGAIKSVGGAELVAHDAEKLLTLLKNVEIDKGDLQIGVVVIALHAVVVALAHCGKLVLQAVGLGKYLVVGNETSA